MLIQILILIINNVIDYYLVKKFQLYIRIIDK